MTPVRCAVREVVLGPGDVHFGDDTTRIHTLLGSCVAVTVWHPVRRVGGMCHYLLPTRGLNQRLSAGHYADEAIGLLLGRLQAQGIAPAQCHAKLFGAGNMFKGSAAGRGEAIDIARENAAAGRRLLARHGFEIRAQDLGGAHHRRIYFDVWSGDVWVRRGSAPAANAPAAP